VDFDFAIFHLEGRSNEKEYIGGDSKCEREKSFKCKRLELEEDKVRVEDKPIFLSQIMDLHAFITLICPKSFSFPNNK
jgi:hypothetical protein